jgi:hypothetical protein
MLESNSRHVFKFFDETFYNTLVIVSHNISIVVALVHWMNGYDYLRWARDAKIRSGFGVTLCIPVILLQRRQSNKISSVKRKDTM